MLDPDERMALIKEAAALDPDQPITVIDDLAKLDPRVWSEKPSAEEDAAQTLPWSCPGGEGRDDGSGI